MSCSGKTKKTYPQPKKCDLEKIGSTTNWPE